VKGFFFGAIWIPSGFPPLTPKTSYRSLSGLMCNILYIVISYKLINFIVVDNTSSTSTSASTSTSTSITTALDYYY